VGQQQNCLMRTAQSFIRETRLRLGMQQARAGEEKGAKEENSIMKFTIAATSLIVLVFCPSVSSQDGLQLFRKMQDALGGGDTIAAVRDYGRAATG
jgi:hypothetical protein